MIKRIKGKPKIDENNYSVPLPAPGCRLSVKFNEDDVFGTLILNGEDISVYLGELKAEQVGRQRIFSLEGPNYMPSCIKRTFLLIER